MEFNVVHVTQYIRHLIKTEFYNLQKNIKSITTLLYWAWSQFKLKIFNFFFFGSFFDSNGQSSKYMKENSSQSLLCKQS